MKKQVFTSSETLTKDQQNYIAKQADIIRCAMSKIAIETGHGYVAASLFEGTNEDYDPKTKQRFYLNNDPDIENKYCNLRVIK